MFSPGAVWGDFTIEFWLSPANAGGREEVHRPGTAPTAGRGQRQPRCTPGPALLHPRPQARVGLRRTCFGSRGPNASRYGSPARGSFSPAPGTITCCASIRAKGCWNTSSTVFPRPSHTSRTRGRRPARSPCPSWGPRTAGPLVLGAGFTGFLDELRISRRVVDDPVLSRFLGKTGVAVSRIIDLGYSSTRVIRIETVDSTPADSGIEFSYQAADTWGGRKLLKSDTDWVPFGPERISGIRSRRATSSCASELYPDGTRTQSPRLSSLRVVYEPNLPPAPPAGLAATPGNGKVTLTWRKVNDLEREGLPRLLRRRRRTTTSARAPPRAPLPSTRAPPRRSRSADWRTARCTTSRWPPTTTREPRQQSAFSAEVSARPSVSRG